MTEGHLMPSSATSANGTSARRAERVQNLAARQMASEFALAEAMARECARMLDQSGPMTVLRVLNARTGFRFSGIYRADPPLLRNLFLYDRENPALDVSGEVSRLDETCSALVWGGERPFETESSATDARLAEHAARERVGSCCGVPIRSPGGGVWGTLCHYDLRPRLLLATEISVLELVAALLAPRLTALSAPG